MATRKKVKLDSGYMNAFMPSGMRGRMGNYGSEMMAGSYMISQPILQAAYIHNGFARLICDKPAEEMTRAGFDLVGLDDKLEQQIQSELQELNATKCFNEAIKWRRAFGGGLIVMGVADGGELVEPLNEDNVTDIEFLRVYDRYEASVMQRYDDPKQANFGEIELWQISPKTGGTSYLIHESRVLVFDGESVPNDVRVANQGWGSSVIQNCFIQLQRMDKSFKTSLLLLDRMQQAVHKIPQLSEQVSTPAGEQLIQKRVEIVDQVRGVINTVVIDADEEYEITSLTVSGVTDIIDRNLRALSAVSSIPIFLLGEYIGGLSNGDSNKEGWYSQVTSWQKDQTQCQWDRLVSLLLLCESEGANDGGEYTLEFKPLFALNDVDTATINYQESQTLGLLIDKQIMDPDEARLVVASKYNLTGGAPEPEPAPLNPLVLNPGQTVVPHPNDPNAKGKKPIVGNAPVPPVKK